MLVEWTNGMLEQEASGATGAGVNGARLPSTGNAAFDAYRDETLRRLEDEREAFAQFLDRLRKAKDQSEFDQFMTERSASSGASSVS